ncbi:sugar porter family MFS transporter [Amorphus orientalis]|uniref:Sugar porter (SP) family MFS transporter n=1 Tax=Amorphus orientalis TaxID=649198 RepID=A0AAE4AUX2_9HYPH|nr:sugar porter family MFS transporter [Amorphus orientalis]MDQ0317622.1 sugar porter (SP) family MFS transporter [Amorphus orientalis]
MMIYFVAAVAGVAGFLFGFDEGVIAGALHLLRAQFDITSTQEGVMTAAVPFGALFGALAAGRAVERFGRRRMLLFAALLFVIGAALASAALGAVMLTLARLVLGFAIGVAGLVAPLYISESSPADKRGMLVSIYQLAITLGILGAYLVGYAFDDSWRTMFAIGMIPGIVLFAGMAVLRDTPRYLAMTGRRDEARKAIASLRGIRTDDPRIETEFAEMVETADADRGHGSWSELFGKVARPALVVAIGLFFLQQLSGINAVIYYAPSVFDEAGFGDSSTQILATVGVGTVNVLMTLVGMALIDRIGRRKLLLAGFLVTALSLAMIAIGAATDAQAMDVVAFVGLVLYIGAFAASIGPLPWVMMSEVFPLSVRGRGMSLASITNWGFNFLVVFSFPILLNHIGLAGVFGIYAFICAIGIIFTFRYVPETNGILLEDIEAFLRTGRPFRQLGMATGPATAAAKGAAE